MPVSTRSVKAMGRRLLALACVAGLACAAPRAEETSDGPGERHELLELVARGYYPSRWYTCATRPSVEGHSTETR